MNQEAKEIQEKYGLTDKQMKKFIHGIGMKWNPSTRKFYIPSYDERDDIDHSTAELVPLTPTMRLKAGLISKSEYDEMMKSYAHPGTKYFSELPEKEQEEITKIFSELEEGGDEE